MTFNAFFYINYYKFTVFLQAERKQKVVFFVSRSLFSKHEISVLTFEMNVNCLDKKKLRPFEKL